MSCSVRTVRRPLSKQMLRMNALGDLGTFGCLAQLRSLPVVILTQVAGVWYMYDPTKPVGQRIMDASLEADPGQCQSSRVPIEPCRTYTLLTNDYLAGT